MYPRDMSEPEGQNEEEGQNCTDCQKHIREAARLGGILDLIASQIRDFDRTNVEQNPGDIPGFSFSLLVNKLRETIKRRDDLPVSKLQPTVEQKVFLNSLTLNAVLKFLKGSDLLNCRLVCKTWEVEATQCLQNPSNGSSHSVIFRWSNDDQKFKHNNGTLQTFQEYFGGTSSRKIPSSHFTFIGGDLGSPDSLSFFSVFGPKIKGLSLTLSILGNSRENLSDPGDPFEIQRLEILGAHEDSRTGYFTLISLLFNSTPNLISLSLTAEMNDWWCDHCVGSLGSKAMNTDSERQQSRSALKQLKHLDVSNLSRVAATSVREILKVAVNLQSIFDPNLCFLEDYLATNIGLEKIKHLNFHPQPELPNCQMVIFADHCGQVNRQIGRLTKLDIYFDWLAEESMDSVRSRPEVRDALIKILRSSAETLEVISSLPPLAYLFEEMDPQLLPEVIPVMTQVKFVTFVGHGLYAAGNQQIFPVGANPGVIFPNLVDLNIDLMGFSPRWPIFNPLSMMPSVRTLRIFNNFEFTTIAIQNCGSVCPNVRNLELEIRGVALFPELCTLIWNSFSLCEKIRFRINCSATSERDLVKPRFCNMVDSAITGLPLDVCEKLRDRPRVNCLTESDLQRLRGDVSICNLKNLTSLTFEMMNWGGVENKPLFTHVSVRYGFQTMWDRDQKLRVQIKSKPTEFLKIVEDFGEMVTSKFEFLDLNKN